MIFQSNLQFRINEALFPSLTLNKVQFIFAHPMFLFARAWLRQFHGYLWGQHVRIREDQMYRRAEKKYICEAMKKAFVFISLFFPSLEEHQTLGRIKEQCVDLKVGLMRYELASKMA